MWSAVVPALNLALLWLLGLLFAFLLVRESLISRSFARISHPLIFLFLVALLVRLVPLVLLPVGAAYDIESFRLVGEALLNGEDVYTSAAAGRHPYFPLQMYTIGAATYLSHTTPLPFIVWLKLPATLADVLITFVIYESFQHWGKSEAASLHWALLYALNPISVLVSAYHGQFDAIPVLLLLLAWYSYRFGRRIIRSAILLGFAILSKTWPLVFLPIAFIRLPNHRQRFGYTFLALSIPILFTTAYVVWFNTDPVPMLRRTLTHAGVPGYWGLSTLIYLPGGLMFNPDQALQLILPLQRGLLLMVVLIVLWWTRHQDALNALLTIILSVFAIMLGMGLQWLLWPIAFAVLACEERWLKWYTLMGTLMMLVHLYGLHLYPWLNQLLEPQAATITLRLVSLPVWSIVVLWILSRLRRAARTTSRQTTEI
jgi:hypothetical protein